MARLTLLVAAAAASVAAGQTVQANTKTYDERVCQPPFDQFPFCDSSLPLGQRVSDIVDRIIQIGGTAVTSQLTARPHGGGGSPPPDSNISALGLPAFDWGLNW